MGRRAADLTTPVPVLGVPALIGAPGWRTTEGDTSVGALLQTWGLQRCSVAVQTSPGIRRAPIQRCAQLTDKLHTRSIHNAQASKSYITKDYKEILLLTKGDKEEWAKSVDSKSKKEVTFQALVGEALGDIVCSQDNSSCFSRTIETNPHFAGTVTNVGPKLKPTVRYTNGSVVDSEAIGGISIENGETTPTHGADQTRVHSHYRKQSRKMLLFSAPRYLSASQQICNHCGGRQSLTAGVEISGKKSVTAPVCQAEIHFKSAHDLLSAGKHLIQLPYETNIQPSNHQPCERATHIDKETSHPQVLHLEEEVLRHRKTRHPACPVHSNNGHFLSERHAMESTQPQTMHADAITKATIKTNENQSLESLPLDSKTPKTGSLPSTPLMATATKSNYPHSQANTKHIHESGVLQNVCVSIHATQEKTPNFYTTATGNLHGVSIPKTVQTFASALMSTEGNCQHENTTPNLAHAAREKNPKYCSQGSLQYPTRFLELNESKLGPSHTLSDLTHTLQEKLSSYSTVVQNSPGILDVDSNGTNTSSKHNPKRLDAKIQPGSSNSELTLKTASLSALSCVTLDSKSGMSAPISTTTNYALYRNTALRSSSSLHPLSTLKEKQNNSHASCNSLLKMSNMSHESSLLHNASPKKPWHTQATDIITSEPALRVFPSWKNMSETAQIALSSLSNMSKHHNKSSHLSNVIQNHQTNSLNSELPADAKLLNGDRGNEIVWSDSKNHPGISQVTNLQTRIRTLKSNSSQLQGCSKIKQQMDAQYQGSMINEHEGQCATYPPGITAQQMDSNTKQFALGISPMHARTEPESKADKQKHPNDPAVSVTAKRSYEPILAKQAITGAHDGRSESNTSSVQEPHAGPKLSLIAAGLCCSEGELASLQCSEDEAILSRDSECSPAAPKLDPEGAILTHSHPTEAAMLLPASPQCSKSASIQQRLDSVEASLAANKDRITTLLHIIHDLEASHSTANGRRCFKTGQDLKNCSTCQKTACIVYSVEYDFRQQERCFLEVVNHHSARGNEAYHEPQNASLKFSLLKKAMKNVRKSKKKSKKLYKILLKWLPRKLQHV
ncbi:uncharacterized protein LOC133551280 isoform X1 [Nerophis ophidion]|uniref:uncharacterized protein LOC133551280 isoform X1 n=1 Tax=Nerophis ophidion TaxID=159077 RepID=UPI002AE092AA|nr:uncharacterized protein LOC133551280 isoform X1 [Nerophis ophidion]